MQRQSSVDGKEGECNVCAAACTAWQWSAYAQCIVQQLCKHTVKTAVSIHCVVVTRYFSWLRCVVLLHWPSHCHTLQGAGRHLTAVKPNWVGLLHAPAACSSGPYEVACVLQLTSPAHAAR